ncbi:hypothetical protein CERZMDRAFT_93664 [Cercospora zeae-maydis SCOH1-5]|uniref:Pentatricopeptide repeat domain-containing protein n=1 Tax=Cercospora zeae-maydis SCOH1-5 TaxID=717836 RepID=A0A6A6FSD6_9PEZI|nr:hypothetical protein CERZMDRAFT_93664 [Cercospora zeae-maydis SCOH1-5]
MNPLFARLGQLESRRAVQTIWTSGKTKRGHWVCRECRSQWRSYSDDTLRWPGSNGIEEQAAQEESRTPWGLRSRNTRVESSVVRSDERKRDEQAVRASDVKHGFFDRHEVSGPEAQGTPHDSEAGSSVENLWEHLEQEASEHHADTPVIEDENLEASMPQDSLLVDYKTELPLAVSQKSTDRIIRCLFSAAQQHDLEFISAIPTSMFSEIVHLVQPGDFVTKLADVHMEVSNAMAEHMRIAKMREIAFEYSGVILRVLRIRRKAGQTPTLEDYTTLLRSARILGSHRSAETIWRSLIKDGIQPTTQCFNHYMGSMVWNGWHNAGVRRNARVVPYNMRKRSAPQPRDTFRFGNYRVGTGGIKERTMRVFSEMLAFGAVADIESFQILITACAREGDITTVNAMLDRVWKIDVPAIMESKDETSLAATDFPHDSPLRPNEGLLSTLAHAYGINNDLPAALRTVDFVARHYNLDITHKTWEALFEWTFVLAEEDVTGNLPLSSVRSLWQTMTGPPYSIKPTLAMYNRLISNLASSKKTFNMIEMMEEALPLARKDQLAARAARDHLIAVVQEQQADEVVEKARQEWEYARLLERRNDFWMRGWVRTLLVAINQLPIITADKDAQLFGLPRLLWEWRRFAPASLSYETATGIIQLQMRSEEDRQHSARVYANILEVMTQLKLQSRRYLGDTWMIDHEESEEVQQHKEKRRRTRLAIVANAHDRKLIETSIPKYLLLTDQLPADEQGEMQRRSAASSSFL